MNDDQQRRHRREFEPPPWEQDAFQRFQRERDESEKEEELERALAQALKTPTEVGEGQEPQTVVEGEGDTTSPEAREYTIPSAQLVELMARLRDEEPRVAGEYRRLSSVVAVVLAVGGVGFVGWSGVLLGKAGSNAGALQMTASLLVMVWGLMMVAFAVVLWRKYNL